MLIFYLVFCLCLTHMVTYSQLMHILYGKSRHSVCLQFSLQFLQMFILSQYQNGRFRHLVIISIETGNILAMFFKKCKIWEWSDDIIVVLCSFTEGLLEALQRRTWRLLRSQYIQPSSSGSLASQTESLPLFDTQTARSSSGCTDSCHLLLSKTNNTI